MTETLYHTFVDKWINTPGRFRLVLIIGLGLLWTIPALAQKKRNNRESARFWVSKGQVLMQASQYAEAYTAFQLARSLGAPNMASQMELAKKRNLNSIQFRALTAQAQLLAATDPTQSLRLLEYARSKFPDSTSLLKIITEVANQPDNWYYSMRADSIRPSPGFTYLLTDTDKCRIYLLRGDSLELVHTFSERPTFRVFSADDRYLFVSTGKAKQGNLYLLQNEKLRPIRTFADSITNVRFSPGNPVDNGRYLLVEKNGRQTQLFDLLTDAKVPIITIPEASVNCVFSPTGGHLAASTGVWQLRQDGVNLVTPLSMDKLNFDNPGRTNFIQFSADSRHFIIARSLQNLPVTPLVYWIYVNLAHFQLNEQGAKATPIDSVLHAMFAPPRRLWSSFSPNGKYLVAAFDEESVLFFFQNNKWHLMGGDPKNDSYPAIHQSIRFSPDSQCVLTIDEDQKRRRFTRLWRLNEERDMKLLVEFPDKEDIAGDVFSPDGKYLLARHITDPLGVDYEPNRLWRIEDDTVRLVHKFANVHRLTSLYTEEGWPANTVYFSANSRYLMTYSAVAQAADSLWQITGEGSYNPQLLRIYGFRNRLKTDYTIFSPDERFLITYGNGRQSAMVWNLEGQVPLFSASPTMTTQALFSPKGNYLVTDNTLWRVTNSQIKRFQHPPLILSPGFCRFSSDEKYLMHTAYSDEFNTPIITSLYQIRPGRFKPIETFTSDPLKYVLLEGVLTIQSYRSGSFSPDGQHWLKSLAIVPGPHPQNEPDDPDTLWTLTPTGLAFSARLAGRIAKHIVSNTNPGSRSFKWHVGPAALFSRDSKFLLTKEKDCLVFYQVKPTFTGGISLAQQKGWPLDVSADAAYWLTQVPDTSWTNDIWHRGDRETKLYGLDFALPNTPDTVRLWQRSGQNWKQLALFNNLYWGMNRHWQNNRSQSWFSMAGNYLLVPTQRPALTTVYKLIGETIKPVMSLNTRLLTAAYIPPSPQGDWETGLLYTDSEQQTYLLHIGLKGSRKTSLDFGILELPPKFQKLCAYWVRKVDDSQQNLEILDLASTMTLIKIPFSSVLDFTVRPNGDTWVVSTNGARLIRSPFSTLDWMKQAHIAPLQPTLRQTYSFN